MRISDWSVDVRSSELRPPKTTSSTLCSVNKRAKCIRVFCSASYDARYAVAAVGVLGCADVVDVRKATGKGLAYGADARASRRCARFCSRYCTGVMLDQRLNAR